MLERFGGGNVFKQPARRVRLSAYLLNVYDTFSAYYHDESSIEWRKRHPQSAEFIDRVKELIDCD